MPYVDLPGVHLWYNDTGGTVCPWCFMHAASGTCESRVYQLPVFTAAGYRCIPYDRRNWGRSRPDLIASTANQPLRRRRRGTGLKALRRHSRASSLAPVSEGLHGLVHSLGLERFHVVATVPAGSVGWTTRCSTRTWSAASWSRTASAAQDPEYRSAAPAPATGNSAVANRVARTRALVPGHSTPRARAAGLRSSTAAVQRGPRGQGSSHGSQ